ncbi:MAG: thioredoxin domain-containing protein, partial [Candidatus Latescibacteria bacterium]|nr:thioredoxin domain-containing protein [Candidatus Latescibacterota bacterium]
REMLQPGGGFYATQDADSEGEEGKFFAWTPGQIVEILGADDGGLFCRYYGVEEIGNFEHGTSVLHVPVEADTLAAHLKIDGAHLGAVLTKGRGQLFDVREQRVKPDRDEKILTDWNGLMIGSLARAYSLLGNRVYLSAAEGTMRFVLDTMYHEGRLLHVYKDGEARLNGYLDDYAFLVSALLDLYEASFDTEWFQMAMALNGTMIDQFWDRDGGGFFFTSSDHEQLIVRSKNPYDNAIPSGNSVAVNNLLRLAAFTGRSDYKEMAEKTLILFHDLMKSAPGGFGQLLSDVAWYVEGGIEIAIIGSEADPATIALLEIVRRRDLRHTVIALHDPVKGPAPVDLIPLLADRQAVNGKPTAYVCRDMVCRQPVSTADELGMILDGP